MERFAGEGSQEVGEARFCRKQLSCAVVAAEDLADSAEPSVTLS